MIAFIVCGNLECDTFFLCANCGYEQELKPCSLILVAHNLVVVSSIKALVLPFVNLLLLLLLMDKKLINKSEN